MQKPVSVGQLISLMKGDTVLRYILIILIFCLEFLVYQDSILHVYNYYTKNCLCSTIRLFYTMHKLLIIYKTIAC